MKIHLGILKKIQTTILLKIYNDFFFTSVSPDNIIQNDIRKDFIQNSKILHKNSTLSSCENIKKFTKILNTNKIRDEKAKKSVKILCDENDLESNPISQMLNNIDSIDVNMETNVSENFEQTPVKLPIVTNKAKFNLYKSISTLPNLYKECTSIEKQNKSIDDEFFNNLELIEKKISHFKNKEKIREIKELGSIKRNEIPKTFIYGKQGDGGFLEDLDIIKKSKIASLVNPESIYNIQVSIEEKVSGIMDKHRKIMQNKKTNHDKVKKIINSMEHTEREANKKIIKFLSKNS